MNIINSEHPFDCFENHERIGTLYVHYIRIGITTLVQHIAFAWHVNWGHTALMESVLTVSYSPLWHELGTYCSHGKRSDSKLQSPVAWTRDILLSWKAFWQWATVPCGMNSGHTALMESVLTVSYSPLWHELGTYCSHGKRSDSKLQSPVAWTRDILLSWKVFWQ